MVMELGETHKSVYGCVSIYQSKITRVYSGKLTWSQIWLSSFGAFFSNFYFLWYGRGDLII